MDENNLNTHTYSGGCFCKSCCNYERKLKIAIKTDKMVDAKALVGKR